MTSSQDLLRGIFDRFASGDAAGAIETLLAACDPEVLVVEPPSLPYGGEYRGADGVLAAFGYVASHLGDASGLRVESVIGDGDEVVVRLVLPWRTPAGASIELPVLEWYRFADGRITEIRPHLWDTAMALGLDSAARSARPVQD